MSLLQRLEALFDQPSVVFIERTLLREAIDCIESLQVERAQMAMQLAQVAEMLPELATAAAAAMGQDVPPEILALFTEVTSSEPAAAVPVCPDPTKANET